MRVISGSAKKRKLKSPGNIAIRPTADKVKEALFNMINALVPGSFFADVYAGTGAVGIEAISRGADKVVYVEKSNRAVALIKANLSLTGFEDQGEIMSCGLEQAIGLMQQKHYLFDVIFADPPYQKGLAAKTLKLLSKAELLHKHGVLILETSTREMLPGSEGLLKQTRQVQYGDTALTFFKLDLGEDE